MNTNSSFLIWNIRGVGSRLSINNLKELLNKHKPICCVLFEPWINGTKATRTIDKLGFTNSFRVECSGFAGGIWLLWN